MYSHKNILAVVLCCLFVILLYTFRGLIIDDAYITFNYAKNFATHFKPWYNLDPEFQGNGQTSLLWMWILAFFQLIGIKPEISFYFINAALGCFLISQFVKSTFYISKKDIVGSFFYVALLSFFTYWLSLNASHGLETLLAGVLLYLFIKSWDKSYNYYALLLVLVRPEFALFNVVWVLDSQFFSKAFFRKIAFSAAGFLIFASYYLVYFDFYIPLPLLLKSNFSSYSFAGIKVFIGYALVFSPIIYDYIKNKKYVEISPLVFLLFYYTFNVNSYSSGIYIRYLFPLMVYFFFIKIDKALIFRILMALSVLRMGDLSFNFYEHTLGILDDNQGFEKSYGKIAKELTSRDRILVFDAGYTAYFTQAITYDGLGLNDATLLMAIRNKDCKTYHDYLERKNINYITLGSSTKTKFTARVEAERLVHDCLGLQNPTTIYDLYSGYYLFVYKVKIE